VINVSVHGSAQRLVGPENDGFDFERNCDCDQS